MLIEKVSVDHLLFDPANARTHDKKNLAAIKGSLRKFGQQKPIVVNSKGEVVAGNGTLAAAKALGWQEIAVVRTSLEGVDATAFALADNRTAELAAWDEEILGKTLQSLRELDFPIADIGFDDWEPEEVEPSLSEADDEIPDIEQNKHGVVLGDVWELGKHRLMCGDSTVLQSVETLMAGSLVDLVHTDPPYNVDYSNGDRPKPGKNNLGKIKNDCMSAASFAEFLQQSLSNAFLVSNQDASIYIWHAASVETVNFYESCKVSGWSINQQIIWKKPMLLGRGRYQWAHEPCIFAVKGKPWFTKDRTKTTVWDFGGYDKSKNVHPTQKPLVVPLEAIMNSSKPKGKVLDLFLGSGSTLLACEKLERTCYGMELDPHYCSVIIERWQKLTGQVALKTEKEQDHGAI